MCLSRHLENPIIIVPLKADPVILHLKADPVIVLLKTDPVIVLLKTDPVIVLLKIDPIIVLLKIDPIIVEDGKIFVRTNMASDEGIINENEIFLTLFLYLFV